jgi:Fic/DOC family
MVAFDSGGALRIDPVVAAAIPAFGFVYVHPFVDGNGRIHRYLIHHALAARGFNRPGVVPVSAAILERIDDYRRVLEDYTRRLLPVVNWDQTKDGNVDVRNDTADFYRFPDVTPQMEFLFECVRKTIDEDLPLEAGFLARYDSFRTFVAEEIADMPERTIDLLFRFLRQKSGRVSRRARRRNFRRSRTQK